MTDGLLESFRHNGWANLELIAVCKGLSDQQLSASATGTYGGILATIQHILDAEASYLGRISGQTPEWAERVEQSTDLDELEGFARELDRTWEELIAGGLDAERALRWHSPYRDAGVETVTGVLTAQTLNHGNEHRSQVCTVLTTIGVEPPELDVWSYAIASGRMTVSD